MSNLTRFLNVVGAEQSGIYPVPGFYLVLFKQADEGRVFDSVLKPEEKPHRLAAWQRMFHNQHEFVSIPVNAQTNLRHSFTSLIEHVSPGHAFEADYLFGFKVGSPAKIAICSADDPVRKIEEEIRRICDPVPRSTEWEMLHAEILRDGAVRYFREQMQDMLSDLQPFAAEYGIELSNLRMILRLSRTDSDPHAGQADLERKKIGMSQETERKIAEMAGDHKVKQLEVLQKQEISRLEGLGKPEEWNQEFAELTLDKAKIILDNLARNINSPEELTRAVRSIASIAGVVRNNGVQKALGSGGGAQDVLELGPAHASSLDSVVQDLSSTLESIAGDAVRRRELGANFLHLIAEAYRGDYSKTEEVEKYRVLVEEMVASDWGGSLGAAQFRVLNQLKDFDTLRERLK